MTDNTDYFKCIQCQKMDMHANIKRTDSLIYC